MSKNSIEILTNVVKSGCQIMALSDDREPGSDITEHVKAVIGLKPRKPIYQVGLGEKSLESRAKSAALSLFNLGALAKGIKTNKEIVRVASIIASAMKVTE